MTDPTTDGYAATPAEIDGMVRNLCAYALSEPDPMQRYVDLTHQQVLFDGIVAAIRLARGRALADLIVDGMPLAEVATKTNLATPTRVRSLISAAGETERVKQATARRSAKPAKAAKPAKKPALAVEIPPPTAIPNGRRVLTAAERVALGLPAEGPIPRAQPPKQSKRRVKV
jgi:hypothetical protein